MYSMVDADFRTDTWCRRDERVLRSVRSLARLEVLVKAAKKRTENPEADFADFRC